MALPEADRIPASAAENRMLAAHVLTLPERVLAKSDYLLGAEFSAADIAFGYTIAIARALGLLENLPHLTAYIERLSERPAFQRAMS
jgi:glutathione S-transferase